jgi:hypothetical protein
VVVLVLFSILLLQSVHPAVSGAHFLRFEKQEMVVMAVAERHFLVLALVLL